MKFSQILTALFLAATAHAAAVETETSCNELCLHKSNECARFHRPEGLCDMEFHKCKDRCKFFRHTEGPPKFHHEHMHEPHMPEPHMPEPPMPKMPPPPMMPPHPM